MRAGGFERPTLATGKLWKRVNRLPNHDNAVGFCVDCMRACVAVLGIVLVIRGCQPRVAVRAGRATDRLVIVCAYHSNLFRNGNLGT